VVAVFFPCPGWVGFSYSLSCCVSPCLSFFYFVRAASFSSRPIGWHDGDHPPFFFPAEPAVPAATRIDEYMVYPFLFPFFLFVEEIGGISSQCGRSCERSALFLSRPVPLPGKGRRCPFSPQRKVMPLSLLPRSIEGPRLPRLGQTRTYIDTPSTRNLFPLLLCQSCGFSSPETGGKRSLVLLFFLPPTEGK